MNINCLFSVRSSPVHINMSSAFRGRNVRTYIYGIRVQRVKGVCIVTTCVFQYFVIIITCKLSHQIYGPLLSLAIGYVYTVYTLLY